jgi:uncharacterized protein (DUF924 family)
MFSPQFERNCFRDLNDRIQTRIFAQNFLERAVDKDQQIWLTVSAHLVRFLAIASSQDIRAVVAIDHKVIENIFEKFDTSLTQGRTDPS